LIAGPQPTESAESHAGRGEWAAVVAVMALAAGLRFFRLGHWSLWADEVFTLRDAADLSGVSGYPVGYFMIGTVVRLLGASEFTARLVPALAGLAGVVLLYAVGRRLFGMRAGLLAAGFLALSCYHIFFSQFARYYTLLMCFGLLAMWAAYRGIARGSWAWLVGAVVLTGVSFWTHWTAAALVPALVAWLLWCLLIPEERRRLRPAHWGLLLGPMVLAGLILGPALAGFFREWRGEAGFSAHRALLVAAKLGDRMEPAILICAGVGSWLLLRERDPRARWLVSFAVVPLVLLVGLVGLSRGGSRFGLVCLPAFLLLAAEGANRLIARARPGRDRYLAWALVGLVMLSLGLKDALYFTVEYGQRPRWREAVRFVLENQRDADFVVTTPEIFEYYAGRKAYGLNRLSEEALSRLLSDDRETWVIVEHVANVAPSLERWRLLRERCELVKWFPVRVRFLDYSVSVLRSPPRPKARRRVDTG